MKSVRFLTAKPATVAEKKRFARDHANFHRISRPYDANKANRVDSVYVHSGEELLSVTGVWLFRKDNGRRIVIDVSPLNPLWFEKNTSRLRRSCLSMHARTSLHHVKLPGKIQMASVRVFSGDINHDSIKDIVIQFTVDRKGTPIQMYRVLHGSLLSN